MSREKRKSHPLRNKHRFWLGHEGPRSKKRPTQLAFIYNRRRLEQIRFNIFCREWCEGSLIFCTTILQPQNDPTVACPLKMESRLIPPLQVADSTTFPSSAGCQQETIVFVAECQVI